MLREAVTIILKNINYPDLGSPPGIHLIIYSLLIETEKFIKNRR